MRAYDLYIHSSPFHKTIVVFLGTHPKGISLFSKRMQSKSPRRTLSIDSWDALTLIAIEVVMSFPALRDHIWNVGLV